MTSKRYIVMSKLALLYHDRFRDSKDEAKELANKLTKENGRDYVIAEVIEDVC